MPYLNLQLGATGTFSPVDFLVVGLVIYIMFHRLDNHGRLNLIIKAIIAWLVIAVIALFWTEKEQDIKFIYNYVLRYALLWLIPVFIINFTARQKVILLKSLYFIVFFVVVVQVYAYLTLDFDFISNSYYQYAKSGSFELYGGAKEHFLYQISNGLPRLYPSGTTLCLAMLGYTLAEMLSKKTKFNLQVFMSVITFGSLIFFLFTLRGRAPIFGLAVIIAVIFGNFLLKKSEKSAGIVSNQTNMKLFGCILLAVIIPILQQVVGFSFIEHLVERIESFDIGFYFETDRSNRAIDNCSALNLIIDKPLFGIGSPSLPLSSLRGSAMGFDVHPVLSVALLFGIPYLLLTFVYIKWSLHGLFALNRYDSSSRAFNYGVAVFYLLLLALLNSVQVFSTAMHLIPFLIFSGLFAAEIKSTKAMLNAEQQRLYKGGG